MRIKQTKFRVSSVHWPLREFNPASKADLSAYKYFLDNNKWGDQGCPFVIEWPFLTVLNCIEDKVIKHHISQLVKHAK